MNITVTKHVVINACQHYLEQLDNEAEDESEIQRIYDTLLSVGDVVMSVQLDEWEVEQLGRWLV
jgi:hypothetical protein